MKRLRTVSDYQLFAQFLAAGNFPVGLTIPEARLHWAKMSQVQRAELSQRFPTGVVQFLAPQTFPLGREEYGSLLERFAKELGCPDAKIQTVCSWWYAASSDTQARLEKEYGLIIDVIEGRIPWPYTRPLPVRLPDAVAS